MMYCRGICSEYEDRTPKPYQHDLKRCTTCAVYMKWDGSKCPCCHLLLRTKSRTGIHKEKLAIKKRVLSSENTTSLSEESQRTFGVYRA